VTSPHRPDIAICPATEADTRSIASIGRAEITEIVDPANEGAERPYRRYGLAEEVVGLDRQF